MFVWCHDVMTWRHDVTKLISPISACRCSKMMIHMYLCIYFGWWVPSYHCVCTCTMSLWSSKNGSHGNSWLSPWLLQFSSCRHLRIKSCSPSVGSEHPSSSCCAKVSVLPHHASSGLHWLPVRHRINFKIASTAFKVLHHQQPSYLAQILPRYIPSRSLWSSSSLTISAPLRKTSMATSKSFSSTASQVWKKLPPHISSASTLPVFRRHLKHHLFPGFTAPTIKIDCITPST